MLSIISQIFCNPSANWYTDTDAAPFVYFKSTLVVPAIPDAEWSTLFLWPGLQPNGGKKYLPIDNGVLQPVLTYGASCAPDPTTLNIDYSKTWWVSAQYVNTVGNYPGFTGCKGGSRMAVQVGDELEMIIELRLGTTVWGQTVRNLKTGEVVTFDFDLQGQDQGWAEWVVEPANGWHPSPPKFLVKDIELRSTSAHPSFCAYSPAVDPTDAGAALICDPPVIIGNICKVAQCKFNGYTTTPVVTPPTPTFPPATDNSSTPPAPTTTPSKTTTTPTKPYSSSNALSIIFYTLLLNIV
eukprot:NODE_202_length_13094_cov_1.571528.p6 type:complete len:296 gc:universal NODE_202_length_13094_cov_1.571528:7991-7104(-)